MDARLTSSLAKADTWPKTINIVLGFEETLKLQLALQAWLMEINGLNRSIRDARRRPSICASTFRPTALTVTDGKAK